VDELKELLYSLAKRFTKSPVETVPGTHVKTVKSTSNEGLKVTIRISIEKYESLYSRQEIDALLAELEREYSPDFGVWRDFKYIYFSRFIDEGGPWIEEQSPGIRFIYEVGKPIIGQIDRAALGQGAQQSLDQSGLGQNEDGDTPPK
jgi:hypothetical protein